MDWDLQVVRGEEGQIHKVSAKIIDDSFSYEGMGPIGVFAQILGVLFTVLQSFIWNSKDELHRKVAQSGLSWHYFFRFITTLEFTNLYIIRKISISNMLVTQFTPQYWESKYMNWLDMSLIKYIVLKIIRKKRKKFFLKNEEIK